MVVKDLKNKILFRRVGYPLHYRLYTINVIVDPFSNEKYAFKKLEWK